MPMAEARWWVRQGPQRHERTMGDGDAPCVRMAATIPELAVGVIVEFQADVVGILAIRAAKTRLGVIIPSFSDRDFRAA